MPSPIGHALAGIAVAWATDPRPLPGTGSWYCRAGGGLTLTCAALAAAPDLDLLVAGAHRTATHSIGAVALVAAVAAALTAGSGRPVARITLMCAVAYGSHLLLDWLGVDYYPPRGIMALWPFSREWYISDLDIFRQTARLRIFTRPVLIVNAQAIAQEIAIMVPVAAAVWLVRVKALAGLAPQVAGRDHPPQ